MEAAVTVRPLVELEATIERGLTTFVEVGQALLEIREHRLYRETHDSFEVYCRDRWGWGRNYTNKLISATEAVSVLGTNVPIPTNEAQARELARLKDEPDAVREVWAEVQEEHDGKQTAAHVQQAVNRRLGVERPQLPRRAPDPEFADDYVEDVPSRPVDEPVDLESLADERDEDGSIARARLLAQYSRGMAAICDLGFLHADAVVRVLSRERRVIHRENVRLLRLWLDAVDRELDAAEERPLQVVGGTRG